MSLFQSSATPFFLHKNAAPVTEGRYDVILSPQFYWVKKVTLPVKREGEAKKLAESVFEGSLPRGHYSYEVRKAADGDFIIIAYDRQAISDALQHYLTQDARVNHVYLSQFACHNLDACCSIDDASSLVNLNGLLMQIPRNCTDPKLTMETFLEEVKPEGKPLRLGTLDEEVVERKTFIFLAAAVALLMLALGVEYVDYKHAASRVEAQKEALIEKYDLPPTTMQLQSIQKRLLRIYTEQKKVRDALMRLSALALVKGEYLKKIDLNKKDATIEIMLSDAKREEAVKREIAKTFKILNAALTDTLLEIKVAL